MTLSSNSSKIIIKKNLIDITDTQCFIFAKEITVRNYSTFPFIESKCFKRDEWKIVIEKIGYKNYHKIIVIKIFSLDTFKTCFSIRYVTEKKL